MGKLARLINLKSHLRTQRSFHQLVAGIFAVAVSTISPHLKADDTDILQACSPLPPAANHNILFVIDDSSSMSSTTGTGVSGLTRWAALEQAFEELMNTLPNLNAGLLIFSQGTMGGFIAHPIAPLDSPAISPVHPAGTPSTNVREEFKKIIANNKLDQGTSTQGAMEEALRYLTGDFVYYGKERVSSPLPQSLTIWRPYGDYEDDPDSERDQLSHPASYTLLSGSVSPIACAWSNAESCANEKIIGNAQYISPYQNMAGDGHVHIVLMVDGGPAGPNDEALVQALTGQSCNNDGEFDEEWGDDRCLRTLAQYIGNSPDLLPNMPGKQTANLSTIAFASGSRNHGLLQELSNLGKGEYYQADTAQQLKQAYIDATNPGPSGDPVDAITFASGASSINLDHGLTHNKDMYFPVFSPMQGPAWQGNLKRYDFQGDPLALKGQNDVLAFDAENGKFHDDVKSFWTQSASDGATTAEGGAASRLPLASNRKLYSNLETNHPLTHPNNRLAWNNPKLLPDHFGTNISNEERRAIIDWLSGEGESANHMGDPLHSVPAILTYGEQGDPTTQRKVAFVGTNQGYLHAIDADTGVELWAFMPSQLLPHARTQMLGSGWASHPYGMDGSPRIWIDNQAPENTIGDANDKIILITGMRRGGNSYYALDITDPTTPDLAWHIQGGITGTSDFIQLGQTWATPALARVKLTADAAPQSVLIVSGGYDAITQDAATVQTPDAIGNVIYMIDPTDGTRLWHSSNTGADLNLADMRYSIPADIAPLDANGDGLTDQFYAADMGGQVWRFDIDNTHANDFVSGGRIAALSGTSTNTHVRFFNKPDISLTVKDNQYKSAIAIGSGSRPTPLNTLVADQFFVLFQDTPFAKPSFYTSITPSELTNRTTNLNGTTNAAGWRMAFPGLGEKVLTKSITLANTVIFPTFTPPPSGQTCDNFDAANVWAVKLLDGKATGVLSGANVINSRAITVKHSSGLLPEPSLILTDNGPALMAGPQQLFGGHSFGLEGHTWQPQIWEQNL